MASASGRPPVSLLLVEDEEIALKTLALILSRKYPNALIHTALNGRIGLEMFKTHRPDVIITDINMPEMNGVRMAAAIREIRPNARFIAITGESHSGFECCIVKPIVFNELFNAVERCLGESDQR